MIAWAAMYESGVHATIAGVVLGLLTRVLPDEDEPVAGRAARAPARPDQRRGGGAVLRADERRGRAHRRDASCSASRSCSASCSGWCWASRSASWAASWLLTRFTRAELNEGLLWRDLFGVAVVGGVGFTVSLLVSDLAFTGTDARAGQDRRTARAR